MAETKQATGVRIRVRGQVQGVGFRPFVWAAAQKLNLTGRVLNDSSGVLIEAHGDADGLARHIAAHAPPLARIDSIDMETDAHLPESDRFVIAASAGGAADTRVTPDAAVCPECTEEIRDPSERRAHYAFANCTHCGPRFSILRDLPYDRAHTSMSPFQLCAECTAEYEDPADRRFHAQPIACPACGPQLWLEVHGKPAPADGIVAAASLLRAGKILAIKGIGGFHLACDATDRTAIATLRARKHRPGKPLALMATLETIRAHANPSPAEIRMLLDPASPVVLLRRARNDLPEDPAPGLDTLGWMLPYTPLHLLLLDRLGRPLVMTSGNLSGAPQVIDNEDARKKLAPFADAFLMHDRDIVRRLDDGVEAEGHAGPFVLRRGRGRAPEPLALPEGLQEAEPGFAWGGEMKSAFCMTKGGSALLSHHLGDLSGAESWDEYQAATEDYADLFEHEARWHACDLHPEYRPSRAAERQSTERGVPLYPVQHHHAHLASALVEHGHPAGGGRVVGLILDGLGLGADGTIWGGEVLLGDYSGYERIAWLSPVPLLGGDAANKEPWRPLLAHLDAAGLGGRADAMLPDAPRALLRRAATAGINAPLTSSAGRLFDAVSAALGLVRGAQCYEGEAAMRLEALARKAPRTAGAYPIGTEATHGPIATDAFWHALINDLASGTAPEIIAYRFHAGLACACTARARALVEDGSAVAVALSGGCFQNALLLECALDGLTDLPTITHRRVPAGDGGLALGQAAIGAASHGANG